MESNVKNQHAFALEDRLIEFGVRVITVVEALPDSRAGNHIAGQLIRSGTSPAPNYAEAQSAESRNDFIHKMKICLKELRETRVWLLMVQRKKMIDSAQRLIPLLEECEELIAIFVASIKTALHNKNSKAPNHNSANAN